MKCEFNLVRNNGNYEYFGAWDVSRTHHVPTIFGSPSCLNESATMSEHYQQFKQTYSAAILEADIYNEFQGVDICFCGMIAYKYDDNLYMVDDVEHEIRDYKKFHSLYQLFRYIYKTMYSGTLYEY